MIRHLLVVSLLLVGAPAAAHKLSDAYLQLELTPAGIDGSIDLALRDLEAAIGLDDDGDGAITWGEVRRAHAAIAAYVSGRLTFSANAGPCPIEPLAHLIDHHTDGAYAVVRFRVACPDGTPARLLRYAVLFDIDPLHRGIVALTDAGATTTAILSPTEPDLAIRDQPLGGRGFVPFFRLGVQHIALGFDHLLFLLVVLLPTVHPSTGGQPHAVLPAWAPALIEAVKVLTAFTLAHAASLGLALTGQVVLPARLVESAIAATILLTAVDNVRPFLPGRRWQVAFAFGLVHGLGFAAALGPLRLPPEGLASALLGFNLGIEAVQILIAALFLAALLPFRSSALYGRRVIPAGSLAASLVAGLWLVDRALGLSLAPF